MCKIQLSNVKYCQMCNAVMLFDIKEQYFPFFFFLFIFCCFFFVFLIHLGVDFFSESLLVCRDRPLFYEVTHIENYRTRLQKRTSTSRQFHAEQTFAFRKKSARIYETKSVCLKEVSRFDWQLCFESARALSCHCQAWSSTSFLSI